jgi:hypothetical protein
MRFLGDNTIDRHPDDYPFLPSRLKTFDYRALLSPDQYSPTGYCERQSDKTTFFRWKIVSRR